MPMNRSTLLSLLLLACAPKAGLPDALDAAPLPLDPTIRAGTLDNGLRWFIEENHDPAARAELRLILDVGSTQEAADQHGAAHFVEHMAFNGTRDFPGNALVAFLEASGVRFGADLNAHTSFEETVYKLQVPTDDPEMLDTALRVLDDWAEGMTLDPAEFERERKVVLEEWRSRRGAGSRVWERVRPLLYFGSAYADHDVIGTEESLLAMDLAALQRFYSDWYRPERMAVAVVGAVDVDEVQERILTLFGDNGRPPPAPIRSPVIIPDHDAVLVLVDGDPELTGGGISLLEKIDWAWPATQAEVRGLIVERLAFSLLSDRLAERSREPDSPLMGAGVGLQALNKQRRMIALWARPRAGRELEATAAVVEEAQRAKAHGFTQGELDRAIANQQREVAGWLAERDSTDSRTHIEEIVRHVLDDEWMSGLDHEAALYQRILPELTLAEVDAVATRLLSGKNRVVLAQLPAAVDSPPLPTQDALLAAIQRAESAPVEPWQDVVVDGPLVPQPPPPGRIVDEQTLPALGITRWTLSNGATIWIKRTDFKQDEIQIAGWSPGGSSLLPDADYFSASIAADVAGRSGVGPYNRKQLQRALAGHKAAAWAGIQESHETLGAASSPEDLDLALRLLYQRVMAPRFDADAFALDQQNRLERLRTRLQDPGARFEDLADAVIWDSHLRRRAWTPEDLGQADPLRAQAIYKERFANAADFHFAIVGKVDLEALRPLVEQWLASLPGDAATREAWQDVGAERAQGPRQEHIFAGTEPKASVRLLLSGDASFDRVSQHRLAILDGLLDQRLRNRIREDLGGTYGVGVSLALHPIPRPGYVASVSFRCDPARVDELVAAIREEMALLRDQPATESEIGRVLEQARRAHELSLKENGRWLGWIRNYQQYGWNIDDISTYELDFESLLAGDDAATLQALAQKVLQDDRLIELVMLPESMATDATAP